MNLNRPHSLRAHEGVLLLDHRNSPGLSDADMEAMGMPAGAGKGVFECPSYTCSHCQTVVFMNPNRQRERAYCRGCEHLICDRCGAAKAAGAPCKTFKQVVDEILAQAETRQAEASSPALILP